MLIYECNTTLANILTTGPIGNLWQPPAAIGGQLEQPDVLKSKLLFGEFVILSQNYSQSAAQKSLLAERIVKLVSVLNLMLCKIN